MLGWNHCTLPLVVFLLLRGAFTSSLALHLAAHNGSASDPPLALNSAPMDPGMPYCRSIFGTGLNPDSCRNVWEKIEPSSHAQDFRPRTLQDRAGYSTPLRYLSDDGRCAIDLELLPLFKTEERWGWDTTDGRTISNVAESIILACVHGTAYGGRVAKFSKPGPRTLDENPLTELHSHSSRADRYCEIIRANS